MDAYASDRTRQGKRLRRARAGALRAFVLMQLLLFAAGVALGVRLGRTDGFAAPEESADADGVYLIELPSNVPDAVELPPYITEDLLSVNPYSRPGDRLTRVNAIVIHYVGNPGTSAAANRSYFQGLAESGETSASSNLIVGLEGETLLCVPLNEVAYCSNDRNRDTVSVEFCHPDDTGEPTQATYDALVRLTAWLCELYGLDPETDVIRHYDVIGKECPRYYVQNEDAWQRFLQDAAAAAEGA